MALTFNDYLKALKEPVIMPCIKLEWLNQDGTVAHEITQDLYNTTGTLNVTYQSGARRSFNISIHNADSKYDVVVDKVWFGQQVKLYLGIYINGEPYLIPQGVFYITNPTEVYNISERTIQLNCVDKWAYLDGSLFGQLNGIYQVPINQSIHDAIKELLQNPKGNGFVLDPETPLYSHYFYEAEDSSGHKLNDTPYTIRVNRDSTYADVLLQFNTMLASTMYYNEFGQLVIEPNDFDLLDRDKEILWRFTPDNSELFSKSTEFKFTETYNHILCFGAVLNGKMASAEVENNDPKSDVSIQRIGRKTRVYEDTHYYSPFLCQKWAEFLLKENAIINKSITLSTAPLYHLDVNRLITITDPKNHYNEERFLINSLSIPLSFSGTMSISATSVNDLVITESKVAGGGSVG